MFFSRLQIGVDIEPYGLRCVVGHYHRGRYYLNKLHYQAFPRALFAEGQVLDWAEVGFHLKKTLVNLGVTKWPIAIALPITSVRIQKLQLPIGLHAKDIQAEINAQLQRDLPGFHEKLKTDYLVSNIPSAPGFNQILFAVVKENILQPYLEGVSSLDLQLNIVDIDIYALKRAILADDNVSMILQLGMITRLVVYQGDDIIFYEQLANEELLPWLLSCLNAVQHLAINKSFIVGERGLIEQTLNDISPFSAQAWMVPTCYSFLPAGFEVAYGLALRAVK